MRFGWSNLGPVDHTLWLALALLLVACGGVEDTDEPTPRPEPPSDVEPPPEPEGPRSYTTTARCAHVAGWASLGDSREVELTVRSLRGRTTATMQIETAAIGWMCLLDQFGPAEERAPRGPGHVRTDVELVWEDPITRDHEDAPLHSVGYDLFVVPDEHLEAAQSFDSRLHAADADRSAICPEALAYRVEVSEEARDARVVPLLEGEPLIGRNRPGAVARAIEGIRAACGDGPVGE